MYIDCEKRAIFTFHSYGDRKYPDVWEIPMYSIGEEVAIGKYLSIEGLYIGGIYDGIGDVIIDNIDDFIC